MKQDEEYWSYYTPDEKAQLEREYLELGKSGAKYLIVHAPREFVELAVTLPKEELGELAQVLDTEQLGELLHHIDPKKVRQAGDAFTVEQLEALLRRKKGKEQNH